MERAIFPAQRQAQFLQSCLSASGLDWVSLATELGVHPRTLSDWRRGKSRIPRAALVSIARKARLTVPASVSFVDEYAHVTEAGRRGAAAVIRKYGHFPVDHAKRLDGWRAWWIKEGQFKEWRYRNPKHVTLPGRSKQLAELIGILLGDGGLSRYQLQVTLNRSTDAPYVRYVKQLLEKLFDTSAGVHYSRHSLGCNVYISSVTAVSFCLRNGLTIGDKIRNGASPPGWVHVSRAYSAACLRGLIDTDGCFFVERHHVKGREYGYYRMHFVSASPVLRGFAFSTLRRLGFDPRVRGRHVTLENPEEVLRYLRVVGTSNPKHLARCLEGCVSG